MRQFLLIIGLCVLMVSTVLADMPQLKIYTEQYEPYNFVDKNNKSRGVQGIAVDLLVEMLEKAGSSQTIGDIKLVPWARGYKELQENSDTLLFSTTRTEQREKEFKWVCPIAALKTEMIALKSKHIVIKNPNEFGNHRIGSVRDDVGEQLIVKAGVPLEKLDRTSQYINNIKKLELGRIDLYVGSWESVLTLCKIHNIDPTVFEPVYTLNVSYLCYAFNRNTSDTVIDKLQSALDKIFASGRMDELRKKYEQ
ncbi:transporter substrate-binding domain-containing protein [bacterium]|nr:transporter substrate-binding domain-containing protein [bacterium]